MLRTTRESQIERQPASLGGQLWITADARIDCREELQRKLPNARAAGAAARVATDSDLILRAYAAWGAECVQHLRGDFAFAIWDAQRRTCYFARATISELSPSTIPNWESCFFSATSSIACASIPNVSAELNDAAIGDFLLFGLNCDVATTTFRDIARLPPAHAHDDFLRWPAHPALLVGAHGRPHPLSARGRLRRTFPDSCCKRPWPTACAGIGWEFYLAAAWIRHTRGHGPRTFRQCRPSTEICAPTPWSTNPCSGPGRPPCARSGRVPEDPPAAYSDGQVAAVRTVGRARNQVARTC